MKEEFKSYTFYQKQVRIIRVFKGKIIYKMKSLIKLKCKLLDKADAQQNSFELEYNHYYP